MYEFELRHYDASIGRFVTTDPYEQFMSPYLAMGNNPIVSFDPDGGNCFDANGNSIACPNGDLYDDYRDNEDNHITIFDEVEVSSSEYNERKEIEQYWKEINNSAEILDRLATLETGQTSSGRAEERRRNEELKNQLAKLSLRVEEVQTIGIIDNPLLDIRSGGAGTVKWLLRLGKVKSVGLPALKKLTINMNHIISGHAAGGLRVSSRKTLFASNLSKRQVENMIKTAYKNGKRVKTQGDRVRVIGQAKDGTVIEMWVNKATKTIETAYPLK